MLNYLINQGTNSFPDTKLNSNSRDQSEICTWVDYHTFLKPGSRVDDVIGIMNLVQIWCHNWHKFCTWYWSLKYFNKVMTSVIHAFGRFLKRGGLNKTTLKLGAHPVIQLTS